MKILFDGFIYSEQKAGGIGRYFNSIIQRLPASYIPMITLEDAYSNVDMPFHNNLKRHNFNTFRPTRLSTISKKCFFQYIDRFSNYDIVHPTYYTLLSGQKLSTLKKPVIITIHDMIYELFQDTMKNSTKHIEWKRDAIKASDAIICVSNNTKKDLLRFFPEVENKIQVIYEGTEIKHSDSYGHETMPDSPYFLYVGGRTNYKNFSFLLTSFQKIVDGKDVKLCIVGAPFTEAEMKEIASLKLDKYIEYIGYVSNAHLAKLYRLSLALVYPSLYEGFGLPPLEAMSCGAPVIASNISSIPEVVGNAGILIDPYKEDDLKDAMLSLLLNNSLREELIEKGFKQASLFDWDKNIHPMINLYNSFS